MIDEEEIKFEAKQPKTVCALSIRRESFTRRSMMSGLERSYFADTS
jgi:hypothetical protein